MKKSTFFLIIATMMAITSSAAPRKIVDGKMSVQDATLSKTKISVPVTKFEEIKKSPLNISSASDIYGVYEYKCYEYVDEEDYIMAPLIEAGAEANDIVIHNAPYNDLDIKATVDVEGNKLILKAYKTDVYMSKYHDYIHFTPFKWVPSQNGEYMDVEEIETLELKIADDGSIIFPSDGPYSSGFMFYVGEGILSAFSNGNFIPINFFEFNSDEWTTYGTGKFTEPIINTLIAAEGQSPVPPYDVEILVNKGNEKTYLIVDPYKGTRFDVADVVENMTPDATGYIMIDASSPECVLVQEFVNSGFGYPRGSNGNYSEMLMFNLEARLVRSGYTVDDVMYEFDGTGDTCSYMENNTIHMLNMCFALDSAPLKSYLWSGVSMREGLLVLEEAGVEGIDADANAPVKFYNLQGLEISNPEKGQPVIRKQGSKAQKMIVK